MCDLLSANASTSQVFELWAFQCDDHGMTGPCPKSWALELVRFPRLKVLRDEPRFDRSLDPFWPMILEVSNNSIPHAWETLGSQICSTQLGRKHVISVSILYCFQNESMPITAFSINPLRLWGRGRKLHRQLPRIFLGAVLGLRALWNPATVFGSEQVQCSPMSDICPKLGWRNMKLSGKPNVCKRLPDFFFGRLPQFCQNDDMRFWYPAMLLLLYLHAGLACSQKELCSL